MYYMRLLRGKADYTRLERTIGRYLPVYALWAVFVAFVLPLEQMAGLR